jgi:ABC-type glutathione transport system ATPase component
MKHSAEHVIEVRDLRVTFTGGPKPVQAVRGVNLAVDRADDLRHE